jgi:hypothetical protein
LSSNLPVDGMVTPWIISKLWLDILLAEQTNLLLLLPVIYSAHARSLSNVTKAPFMFVDALG